MKPLSELVPAGAFFCTGDWTGLFFVCAAFWLGCLFAGADLVALSLFVCVASRRRLASRAVQAGRCGEVRGGSDGGGESRGGGAGGGCPKIVAADGAYAPVPVRSCEEVRMRLAGRFLLRMRGRFADLRAVPGLTEAMAVVGMRIFRTEMWRGYEAVRRFSRRSRPDGGDSCRRGRTRLRRRSGNAAAESPIGNAAGRCDEGARHYAGHPRLWCRSETVLRPDQRSMRGTMKPVCASSHHSQSRSSSVCSRMTSSSVTAVSPTFCVSVAGTPFLAVGVPVSASSA